MFVQPNGIDDLNEQRITELGFDYRGRYVISYVFTRNGSFAHAQNKTVHMVIQV